IFGISGFAVGELLFEILLPNFGIDLRAPGFIVEMALVGLIAFAVREKSFLQELIVPEADAHLLTKPTYTLDRGNTYAVLEREAILLVPFDPTAFIEREIALIRREVRLLGPLAEEFGPVARVSR